MNRGDKWWRLQQWPGVRRAGLPRLSGGADARPAALDSYLQIDSATAAEDTRARGGRGRTSKRSGQQQSAPRQDRFPSQTDHPAMPSAMIGSIGQPPGQTATTTKATRTPAA
jgi:hypothetical protein